MKLRKFDGYISDEKLDKAAREVKVMRKLVTVLRKIKPESRGNVLRAVASIYGYEV